MCIRDRVMTFIMRVFSVVLLVMVGVNFSVGPAGLLAKLTPDMLGTMFWPVSYTHLHSGSGRRVREVIYPPRTVACRVRRFTKGYGSG